jgi:hypothetical protein
MGDIVFLQAYRLRAPLTDATAQKAGGAPSDVAQAFGGMMSGVGRMRAASRLLGDLVVELRELAGCDADQTEPP